MNLRRRQQPAPQGQWTVTGATRPPLVTGQQETPPPVNAVYSENPGPTTIEQAMRNRLAAKDRYIAELETANRSLKAHAETMDRRWQVANAELTTVRDGLHRTIRAMDAEIRGLRGQVAQAGRPPGTDPQPTGVVPLATGPLISTSGPEIVAMDGRDYITPWRTGAWTPRSSAVPEAPKAGEV